MYSSEDLERFYFQYQTEAMPKGISIEQFCLKNKVPYNIFNKWYRDTRKKIVKLQVDGKPIQSEEHPSNQYDAESGQKEKSSVRILVEIRMTYGLHLSQKNLSYLCN